MLPKKAEWIKQGVVSFDPENCKLTTTEGDEISYEYLVVAMGLQLNYNQVYTICLSKFKRSYNHTLVHDLKRKGEF